MRAKNAFPIILDSIKLWWQDWANQVLVAFAAILLSLTVVLYPLAIFGVTEQALDLTHGIRTGLIGFWKGFKTYWRKSLPWGVLNLLVIALLGFNVWFYRSIRSAIGLPLMVLMSALLVFWLIWQLFLLAGGEDAQTRLEKRLGDHSDAARICLHHRDCDVDPFRVVSYHVHSFIPGFYTLDRYPGFAGCASHYQAKQGIICYTKN